MARPYSKDNGFIQKYKRKDNASGITGVSYNSTRGKWQAILNFNGKLYWGGSHKNKDNAIRSRLRLEFKRFGIEQMPQCKIIPDYFKSPKSLILIAYNEFKRKEERRKNDIKF